MKTKLFLAALLSVGASVAIAQTAVTIEAPVQTKIKEYVVKEKKTSVAVPAGFTLSVGATLPEAVEVYTLPADVGPYRYAVIGGKTVLLEPSSRRVVYIME